MRNDGLIAAGRRRAAGARRPPAATARGPRATRRACRARGRRRTSAPSGSHAWPMNITRPWGSRISASPRTRSAATDHSSSSSRVSVVNGLSPRSTAPPAPSAQRPGQLASHAARRPASQRPARSRTMHIAAIDRLASASTRRSAQRAGCSSRRSWPSTSSWATRRAARPSWLGEPRSASAVIAASAASVRSAGGSKCSSRQRGLHLVGLPRSAGEQLPERRASLL